MSIKGSKSEIRKTQIEQNESFVQFGAGGKSIFALGQGTGCEKFNKQNAKRASLLRKRVVTLFIFTDVEVD